MANHGWSGSTAGHLLSQDLEEQSRWWATRSSTKNPVRAQPGGDSGGGHAEASGHAALGMEFLPLTWLPCTWRAGEA